MELNIKILGPTRYLRILLNILKLLLVVLISVLLGERLVTLLGCWKG